ncbi:exported hypothetical protein [Candidatus Sulfopaludibacter sp. SbA3]|nr:exported hypothetical protein [Candidatus Sulfopaludibacter sp. SbA3]
MVITSGMIWVGMVVVVFPRLSGLLPTMVPVKVPPPKSTAAVTEKFHSGNGVTVFPWLEFGLLFALTELCSGMTVS